MVTIYCSCGNTFKTEMYDIREHGAAYVKCQSCGKEYAAEYIGWEVKKLKKEKGI